MKLSFATVGVAAAGCTGSGDPVVTGTICYHGVAGALGLHENVDVKIRDFASESGHMDVSGDGIMKFSCSNKAFSKHGQDVDTDLSDCAPAGVSINSVKYCSDQDQVEVTVKDKAVPAPIKVSLKKVACDSEQTSAMDQMWMSFLSSNEVEVAPSRAAFEENVATIIEENRKDQGFYLGVNQYSGISNAEFKKTYLGFNMPESDSPRFEYVAQGLDVPDSVDWSSKGAVTPVKNQGTCGSCWAFSTTGSLEGRAQIAKGSLVAFSEQQLVDCDKAGADKGCGGGLMDNAFKYFEQHDVCTESSYPYKGAGGGGCKASSCSVGLKHTDLTGFVDVQKNEQALAEAVAQGPVSIAVEADTVFQLYFGGIMSFPCGAKLDHGVLAVGYGVENGKKYWKVKNSWGGAWGEHGYIRLQKGKGGQGECGILAQASYPQIAAGSVSV